MLLAFFRKKQIVTREQLLAIWDEVEKDQRSVELGTAEWHRFTSHSIIMREVITTFDAWRMVNGHKDVKRKTLLRELKEILKTEKDMLKSAPNEVAQRVRNERIEMIDRLINKFSAQGSK